MNRLKIFDEVNVSHTYRETNFYTDALAKFGASIREDLYFFFENIFLIIRPLMHFDAVVVPLFLSGLRLTL